jgi:hypothetical protein
MQGGKMDSRSIYDFLWKHHARDAGRNFRLIEKRAAG